MVQSLGRDGRVTQRARLIAALILAAGIAASVAILLGLQPPRAAGQAAGDPAAVGSYGAPFSEPTIGDTRTDERCLPTDPGDTDRALSCKPSAGSVTVLPAGKDEVLYWDNLEGTENVQQSIVLEYGHVSGNDQTRRLDLNGGDPQWRVPQPPTGGASQTGELHPLLPGLESTETYNDGALFCSDQNLLPDGSVLAAGGTAYYDDPTIADLGDIQLGVAELEGLTKTRIYHPETNTWRQSDDMDTGRWYPTLVSLADGDQFVASGVRKLIKPVYPDRPAESGTNVKQTERFDLDSGTWSDNGASAQRSLPLFPRLHLLPNGDIFYNAAGQSFNPAGQSYDEALWNIAATYDPDAKSWTDLGVPGGSGTGADLGTPVGDLAELGIPGGGKAFTHPGFRGSTFSVMLPLSPDGDGEYPAAEFLTAGGVLNPPSPGSYFATSDSRITTVRTDGDEATMSTRATGDMTRPRWYGAGTLLPTGEVLVTSGADRDEVAAPGTERPVKKAELFDPETETWRRVAEARQPRTYHNTAALLPDGRVLIGGHAPISTLYTKNMTLVPGLTAPNNGRDPSFEIYSPPYLFRGDRPVIRKVRGTWDYGATNGVRVNIDTDNVESVTLMRYTSQTHVVDGDQRAIELPIRARRDGGLLLVRTPPSGKVAPPGDYMLFVNRKGDDGPVPSVSRRISIGVK